MMKASWALYHRQYVLQLKDKIGKKSICVLLIANISLILNLR